MARVTVEDCVRKVSNRFELVLIAAARARQIASGQGVDLQVERDGDRNPVVALREIADGKITLEEMNQKIIESFSHQLVSEEAVVEEKEGSVSMSEEDMLEKLKALDVERLDLSSDHGEDRIIAGFRSLDEEEGEEEDVVGIRLGDVVEEYGGDVGLADEDEEEIGDEIGEAIEGGGDLMGGMEIDEEMIGEAISSDAMGSAVEGSDAIESEEIGVEAGVEGSEEEGSGGFEGFDDKREEE